jgi:hypothetical protein
MVTPLTNLTKKKIRFTSTPECEQSFSEVKNALVNAPILSCPNFEHPFTSQCDTSDVGIGAVLTQNIGEKKYFSVIYVIERLQCYL